MTAYWRPILGQGPRQGSPLGESPLWFETVEKIERGGNREELGLASLDADTLETLTSPRPQICGLSMDRHRIMGILNVTPDSFSDGGRLEDIDLAVQTAKNMVANGADILDVGGESTRPGAKEVPVQEEIDRVVPLIERIKTLAPVSIDTRKSEVARAALDAGAAMVNDVSALTFDPEMARLVAERSVPICLMHAQGAPETMQDNPQYGDVLLDVYDGLSDAINRARAAGIAKTNIIADPGIGFGKTLDHNLTLLRDIALFHGLGVPTLLGASRKRFIGTITGEADAGQRLAGSLTVALHAAAQGVQIIRVHDIKETNEALKMAAALYEQI